MADKNKDPEAVFAFIKMGLSLALSFADMASMLSNAGYEVPSYEEVQRRIKELEDLEDLPTA